MESLFCEKYIFFLLKKSDPRSSFFSLEKRFFKKSLEWIAGLASKK
jgi:hypothetical protein